MGVTKDYREAVKWYLKAAAQGESSAMLNLGNCYSLGKGVSEDQSEAIKWYRKAAQKDAAGAQYNERYIILRVKVFLKI